MPRVVLLAAVLLASPAAAQAGVETVRREVRGTVVDEQGKPLAGVAVGWFVPWDRTLPEEAAAKPSATTGVDGAFAFTVAAAESGPPWLWLVAAGRVHVVCDPEHAPWEPIVLPKAHALSGRVVDKDGKPVAG